MRRVMKHGIMQTHFIRKANSFSILIYHLINGTESIRKCDWVTASVNTPEPYVVQNEKKKKRIKAFW